MQRTSPGRKRFTPQERNEILTSYLRSGLTQREFVATVGISLSCLHRWLRLDPPQNSTPRPPVGFLEVPSALPADCSASSGYWARFPGDVSLEIPHGFVPEELRQLCQIFKNL